MSITERQDPQISISNLARDRNQTQNLEKILLSSSSSSSQRKLGSLDVHKVILTTQELASNGGATQRTASNHGNGRAFNNTGRNWRNLITPAQDSLNKLNKQQQPDYSGYNPGSRVTTQNDKIIGATTNSENTSMDTSNLSMSVKQFTPSQDLRQLKMTLRGENSQQTDQAHHQSSLIGEATQDNHQKSKQSYLFGKNHLDTIEDEEGKSIKQSYLLNDHFGASTSQLKSLMKSYSNGNFEYYENLQRKYFANAKDKSQMSSKPPTSSQINLDKSEKDLFNLTSKTNTQLGISQFKSSIQSFGKSQMNDKPSILRASSLRDNRQKKSGNQQDKENQVIKSAMSINFKNSLYKKINPSNNILDDNSQSQLDNRSKMRHDRSLQRKIMQSFHLDSSSSEESDHDKEDLKQPINLQSHIKNNQIQVLGEYQMGMQKRRDNQRSKDSLEDAILRSEFNILSRRDLSSRQDNKSPISAGRSSNNKSQEKRNSNFHRDFRQDKSRDRSRSNGAGNQHTSSKNIDDSSLNLFQRLLSSGYNNAAPKITSNLSSVILSNPDFNLQSQMRHDETNIIFEQPTKEDALEDTYKLQNRDKRQSSNARNQQSLNIQFKDLKPEDLTTVVENGFNSQIDESSQISQQDEVFNAFKEHLMNARNQILATDVGRNNHDQQRRQSQHNIQEQEKLSSFKEIHQQKIPERSQLIGGKTQKNVGLREQMSNQVIDQKSDFTFVLSNPTDFQCECCANNQNQMIVDNPNNQSIVTNKFKKPQTAQNSDFKQQNLSSYRKGPFQTIGQPSRLQDFAASPIYSESGGPPGNKFHLNIPVGVCHNCGGCKSNIPQPQMMRKQSSTTNHKLSCNNNGYYQSIKEESHDEDDEYYQHQNFVDSQIDDSGQTQANYNNQQQQYSNQNQPANGFSHQNQTMQYDNQTEIQQRQSDLKEKEGVIFLNNPSSNQNQFAYLNNHNHSQVSNQEEVQRLQQIISFSQNYMGKLLHEQCSFNDLKNHLAQLMGALSSASQPLPLIPQSQMIPTTHQMSFDQGHFQSEMNNNHFASQQTTLIPGSVVKDNNMTMSELQQMHILQRNQAQNDRMRHHNVNNIIHEEVSTANEESIDQSLANAEIINHNQTKLEEFTQTQGTLKQTDLLQNMGQARQIQNLHQRDLQNRKKNKKQNESQQQLPNNLQNKYNKLKNSLISSAGDGFKMTNKLKEETIYSYVDADDESFEDEEEYDEIDLPEGNQLKIQMPQLNRRGKAGANYLRQSDYLSNRSNYNQQSQYGRSSIRKLRQSQNGQVALLSYIKANEIKLSLKRTKRSLLSTKLKLRKEQYRNQEREDLLKKLQTEIEELNLRQKLTEDKIQSKDNMIQVLQRISSQNPSSVSNSIIQGHQQSNNRSFNSNLGKEQSMAGIQSKNNNTSLNQTREISPHLRTGNSILQNNCDVSTSSNYVSHNIKQGKGQTPDTSVNQGGLDASSKSLLEINDRLTKQIEDNLALFEDLNQELTLKDKVIAESQARLKEKQQEIESLTQKINQMSSSMQKLMDLSQRSNQGKEKQDSQVSHQKQMEKLKEQQAHFQSKIDKIQQVYSNINQVTIQSLYGTESNSNSQLYSKYQKRSNFHDLGGNSALNCIPLSSPRTSFGGTNLLPISQSNNSSRIQDEEFSIGQIRNKQSIDADFIPVSQRQNIEHFGTINSDYMANKENNLQSAQGPHQKQREDSLLNSKTLKSLYNDLKSSVKDYNNLSKDYEQQNSFKQTLFQATNVFDQHQTNANQNEDESTLLKYSQDVTKSLINTLNLRAQ